jgi:adenosylcobinamide kinase/adenosylcobinamide-phosphate guanylyltransferase
MKVLFIGGIKSGKSLNAEKYIQKLSYAKPVYLATTEFIDDETSKRIKQHQAQRSDNFITVEESLALSDEIKKHEKRAVLVECLSIWVNNMFYHEKSFDEMQEEINKVMMLERDIVFVINDVSSGVIPENALARKFVDANGKIAQFVASACDEVYHVVAGIAVRIK